jgi:hypothetical protein
VASCAPSASPAGTRDPVHPEPFCQSGNDTIDKADLQLAELLIELRGSEDVLLDGGLEIECRRGVEKLLEELAHRGAISSQEVVDLDEHGRGNHDSGSASQRTRVGGPARPTVRSSGYGSEKTAGVRDERTSHQSRKSL